MEKNMKEIMLKKIKEMYKDLGDVSGKLVKESFSENDVREDALLTIIVFDEYFINIYECHFINKRFSYNSMVVDKDMLKDNLF